jgi:hypothetical protein
MYVNCVSLYCIKLYALAFPIAGKNALNGKNSQKK